MTQRLNYTTIAPSGVKALGGVYGYILQCGLPGSLVNLAYCASRRSMVAPIASTCTRAT
jgi:hypothetical protein